MIIGVILSVVSSFFLYNILGIGIGDINCINICFLALFVLFQGVLWYIAINKYFTINLLISFIKEPFINVLLIIFVILVVILKL
ncbi:hypothetical protein SDC9_87356 [bioreactor metagenome]|uniref:Uncharacterized protein n=1 Tax=bioreactor metagenome TaxID=1076179 RepID=A0A644ZK60_9ZZZZ